MPYKHIEKKIPTKLKRSAKLTQEDKDEIRKMYAMGGWSYRTLAEEFNVSKRTIGFVIKPEKQKENYEKRVARGGSKQILRQRQTN